MIAIALIGAGSIGSIHAANIDLSRRADLVAIADTDAERAAALAAQHGSRSLPTEQIFTAGVDGVIVAASTAAHGALVESCIDAGIPFLCEKPLATDLDLAVRLHQQATRRGLICAIGFNRRYAAEYVELRNAVRAGAIGDPESLIVTSRSEAPPTPEFVRSSGGLLGEKGSHFYDLARWISGEEPTEVFATGSVLVNPGFADIGEVDTAKVFLSMPSGLQCLFDFSWRSGYGQDERLEIHGAGGMLQNRQEHGPILRHFAAEGRKLPGVLPSWRQRFASTYIDELNGFLDAIETGDPGNLPRLADGVAAQRIAVEAYRSIKTNRPRSLGDPPGSGNERNP